MQANAQVKTQATDSQVALWRGAIALAWADQQLDEDEKSKLLEYIVGYLYFSEAQRAMLVQDVSQGVRIVDVWPHITDKQDRAHLINIAPVIFWRDEVFCQAEQDVYNTIFAEHMATLDVAATMADLRAMAVSDRSEWAQEEKELVSRLSLAGRIIHYFENKTL